MGVDLYLEHERREKEDQIKFNNLLEKISPLLIGEDVYILAKVAMALLLNISNCSVKDKNFFLKECIKNFEKNLEKEE